MNRFEAIEAAIADATTSSGDEARRLGLLGVLRDASLTLDALWHSAIREGPQDMVLPLGEASHAVHRALVALADTAPASPGLGRPRLAG